MFFLPGDVDAGKRRGRYKNEFVIVNKVYGVRIYLFVYYFSPVLPLEDGGKVGNRDNMSNRVIYIAKSTRGRLDEDLVSIIFGRTISRGYKSNERLTSIVTNNWPFKTKTITRQFRSVFFFRSRDEKKKKKYHFCRTGRIFPLRCNFVDCQPSGQQTTSSVFRQSNNNNNILAMAKIISAARYVYNSGPPPRLDICRLLFPPPGVDPRKTTHRIFKYLYAAKRTSFHI